MATNYQQHIDRLNEQIAELQDQKQRLRRLARIQTKVEAGDLSPQYQRLALELSKEHPLPARNQDPFYLAVTVEEVEDWTADTPIHWLVQAVEQARTRKASTVDISGLDPSSI